MAKLSANGKELLRIQQEREVNDPERNITWQRVTRTYHSNGKILEKCDVRFKPTSYEPKGELHSYGWKVYAKIKKGFDPAEHAAKKAQFIRDGKSVWTIVNGGPAPVIISQSRIMRAVESGDSIGFCRECGHETDGVEPDARNYHCDHCGANAVYGAEEMLIG
jgi:hypothetical protein